MLSEKDHLLSAKNRILSLIKQKENELLRLREAFDTLHDAGKIMDGKLPNVGEKFGSLSITMQKAHQFASSLSLKVQRSKWGSITQGLKQILAAINPGDRFSVPELHNMWPLETRNKVSTASIRSSLSRMIKRGEITKLGRRAYRRERKSPS